MKNNPLTIIWATVLLAILWGVSSYLLADGYYRSRISNIVAHESQNAQSEADELADSIRRNLHYFSGISGLFSHALRIDKAVSRFGTNTVPSALPYASRKKRWTANPVLNDLSRYLALAQNSLGADLIYVINAAGDCIAASNWNTAETPIGTNFAEREYFKLNISSKPGMQYAVGKTTHIAGLYFSSPVIINGKFMGAVIAKTDVPKLSFLTKLTDAFVTDKNGVIILAHDHYMEMMALPDVPLRVLPQQDIINYYQRTNFQTLQISPWDQGMLSAAHRINGEDTPYALATRDLPEYGLTVHAARELNTLPILEKEYAWIPLWISIGGSLLLAIIGVAAYYLLVILHGREVQRASQSKLAAFLNTSMDSIIGMDSNGIVIVWSDAAEMTFGWSREEALGKALHTLIIPERYREQHLHSLTSEKLQTPGKRFEISALHRDGREFPVELAMNMVESDGKKEFSAFIRDIQERKQAELTLIETAYQLEQKELSKTRFLAAAGHDLRQPLTAANLYIDTLKLTDPTPQQGKIIQRLINSMAIFKGLLDTLLNISQLDSGMIKPEYTLIDVSVLFGELEQVFAPIASEKSLGLKLYFPTRKALVVNSDIALVKSVLMNLVANAIKYTSQGAVLISARKRGSNVLFQVWDTGIGIADDQLEHIFDEFYQINNLQRDRTSGLGLGLSIAKRAITLLGGKITCRSQIGQGSVFGFRLPLDSYPDLALRQEFAGATAESMADSSFVAGKHFVVVEDDTLVAQAIASALEEMGGEVRHFHKATDALHHFNIEHADCFIVDYMLGGAHNGIQFLNQIRLKLDKPIRAVLVTGDTSATLIREAANSDWPVLYKPVNLVNLIESLSAQAR